MKSPICQKLGIEFPLFAFSHCRDVVAAVSKAGGSLRDVQELAGHRSLKTTEHYIEGDRDAQRKLIRMI